MRQFIIKQAELPRWPSGKESACQYRFGFNPWARKILWSRKWQSTPVFLPGEFHRRTWQDYRPRAAESDTTEPMALLSYLWFNGSDDHPRLQCLFESLILLSKMHHFQHAGLTRFIKFLHNLPGCPVVKTLCFQLQGVCISKNLPISSKLLNLLVYCSYFLFIILKVCRIDSNISTFILGISNLSSPHPLLARSFSLEAYQVYSSF